MAAYLRALDFAGEELAHLDAALARAVGERPEIRRLLTVPGIDMGMAAGLLAAVGDIYRFATAPKLVGYIGLDPRVRQSGLQPARHGPITKQGRAHARGLLVRICLGPRRRRKRLVCRTHRHVPLFPWKPWQQGRIVDRVAPCGYVMSEAPRKPLDAAEVGVEGLLESEAAHDSQISPSRGTRRSARRKPSQPRLLLFRSHLLWVTSLSMWPEVSPAPRTDRHSPFRNARKTFSADRCGFISIRHFVRMLSQAVQRSQFAGNACRQCMQAYDCNV